MLQKSDFLLLELINNIEQSASLKMKKDTLNSALYILDQYVLAIIKGRYITENYIHFILAEIIQTNIKPDELILKISKYFKEQSNYDPKTVEAIIYILSIFVKTACKTKEVIKPQLKTYTRDFLARKLNCGRYAEPVNKVINQMFGTQKLIQQNQGSILAEKVIKKMKNEGQL